MKTIMLTDDELEVLRALILAEVETGEFEACGGECGVEMNRDDSVDCLLGIVDKLEGAE